MQILAQQFKQNEDDEDRSQEPMTKRGLLRNSERPSSTARSRRPYQQESEEEEEEEDDFEDESEVAYGEPAKDEETIKQE